MVDNLSTFPYVNSLAQFQVQLTSFTVCFFFREVEFQFNGTIDCFILLSRAYNTNVGVVNDVYTARWGGYGGGGGGCNGGGGGGGFIGKCRFNCQLFGYSVLYIKNGGFEEISLNNCFNFA